jgi:hypothetical protein
VDPTEARKATVRRFGRSAEARCARVERIVWARLPTYPAGPFARSKWAALSRYLDEVSLAIDNNAAERAFIQPLIELFQEAIPLAKDREKLDRAAIGAA